MKKIFAGLLLVLGSLQASAQTQRIFQQAELDALLAPVALYPDSVLPQIFVAAGYPQQVREAANWSRANPHLRGDTAVREAQAYGWHPAVASLAAFPELLARMDESPQWLRDLGDAWHSQEPYVMDSVQRLRQRAHAGGQLRSAQPRQIIRQTRIIVVQPLHLHAPVRHHRHHRHFPIVVHALPRPARRQPPAPLNFSNGRLAPVTAPRPAAAATGRAALDLTRAARKANRDEHRESGRRHRGRAGQIDPLAGGSPQRGSVLLRPGFRR